MGPLLIPFLLCVDFGDYWAPGGSEIHVKKDAIVAVLDTLPPGPCAMVVTSNQSKFAVLGTVKEVLERLAEEPPT